MKTTLNKIREHSPCAPGFKKLLRSLNKTKADDQPISILQILDSNGLADALWCLRAVTGRDREIRHYIVWVARQVQHLMTDQRSKDALQMAEWFADGLATKKELAAAESAAWDAWDAEAAERDAAAAWAAVATAAATAARGAAKAAAGARAAVRAAAWSASGDAARAAQEKKLRELCAWCDHNPLYWQG